MRFHRRRHRSRTPLFRRMDKALRYPRQLAIAWSAWLLTGLMLTGVLLAELAAQARLAALLSWPNAVALIVISGALLGRQPGGRAAALSGMGA